jgi:hypothetical protein
MKFRRAMAVVGMFGAATMASLAGAPAASAATYTMHTDDGDPGGRVSFQTDGDAVELCDIEADGWAVYLKVTDVTQNKFKYDYRIGGDGRCQTFRASLGAPYNLKEGDVIRFTICLNKDGRNAYCDTSDWANTN